MNLHRFGLLQRVVFLLAIVPLMFLQSCHDSEDQTASAAPRQLANINDAVYTQIRANPTADALFNNIAAAVGSTALCDVKLHRIRYNTVGGAGESATSSGVFMLPHGDSAACSGPRPLVLYAHATSTYSSYDLSQFLDATNPNPASTEAVLLLAAYAAQGYAVIAPNYAGYADSSLDYHPYLDETQQSTEMMDALDHVRSYAGFLGANLSSDLFVTGVSQGGYVAMATHKALQARGDTVTASLPISGPYAMLEFVDTIMAGYVSGGATIFAPMLITALEKAHDAYNDPAEIYATAYASIAENALPNAGGFDASGLPDSALFSGNIAPLPAGANPAGFGADHLLADSFRAAYLADAQANPTEPALHIRALGADLDLRNWIPQAPMMMCGAGNDPLSYHQNSDSMFDYITANAPALVNAGAVINLDLTDTPAGPFAPIMQAWQAAAWPLEEVHEQAGVFCSLAGISYFASLRTQ